MVVRRSLFMRCMLMHVDKTVYSVQQCNLLKPLAVYCNPLYLNNMFGVTFAKRKTEKFFAVNLLREYIMVNKVSDILNYKLIILYKKSYLICQISNILP